MGAWVVINADWYKPKLRREAGAAHCCDGIVGPCPGKGVHAVRASLRYIWLP